MNFAEFARFSDEWHRDCETWARPTMRKNRAEQSRRNPTLRVISGDASDSRHIRTDLRVPRAMSAMGGKRTLRPAQHLAGLPLVHLCFDANDFGDVVLRCHPFCKMAAGDGQQVLDRRYGTEIEGSRITLHLQLQVLIPR